MIRVTFDDDTVADLPEETPADPFCEPGADETPMTLEQVRLDSTAAHVLIGGTWRGCLVETWAEEARRLRTERDAAEKKLAALRAWADNARHWTQAAIGRSLGDVFAILNGREAP